MGFGEVVRQVRFISRSPENFVVAISDPISNPIVTHIDCFRALQSDRSIGNTIGSGIISDYRYCFLGIAEVYQSLSGIHSRLAIDKETGVLCFGGRGYNSRDNDANSVDGTINWRSSGTA